MDTPDPSPPVRARQLLRSIDRAALATRRREDDSTGGWPYVALVLLAVDHDASPLLLLSALAEHSKDIAKDDRVSLLIDGTIGLDDPLTGARVTLLGRLRKTDDTRHRVRFLNRHPGAGMYADFKDFSFYRMQVERAHLVAGFGRIHWIEGAALLDNAGDAAALIEREADIVQHMNEDHGDALALYATRLLRQPSAGNGNLWTMTGVDAEGCDLRLSGSMTGGRVARLPFHHRITNADQARAELVRLAKQARTTP
jgi:putative heme iron utilization protein